MSKAKSDKADFFVSYTSSDTEIAEWIKWQLEDKDYSVVIQNSSPPQGHSFDEEMKEALEHADKIVVVISDAYFKSKFSTSELEAALSNDPAGMNNILIPVRVEDFDASSVRKLNCYIDIVDCDESRAKLLLLDGVEGKHHRSPTFPLSKDSTAQQAQTPEELAESTFKPKSKPEPKPRSEDKKKSEDPQPEYEKSIGHNVILVFIAILTPIIFFTMMIGLQMTKFGATSTYELVIALIISAVPILYIGGIPISNLRVKNKADVSVFVWGYYIAYVLSLIPFYPTLFFISCNVSYFLGYLGCPR